ncbi:glycosyltransferase [Cyclobacterium xiamenense]|uniref:glycosyltransferase n=1 Tax=Cyclobacterium xiamenense TaxID=1297121 RepID=UPI0012B7C6EE|nr:family 2 glycosyl transferase [Cyclobacterium xiamenense]
MPSLQSTIATYTGRFSVNAPYFNDMPSPELGLVLVIPAYKEPAIQRTLDSLGNCQAPGGMVEVVCVVNAPEGAASIDLETNEECVRQIEEWKHRHPGHFLSVKIIREESLHQKKAGAGLARKLGMDEALHRWGKLDKNGPILCLDADCEVSEDYFLAAEKAFENPALELAHFQFEHRYADESNPKLAAGIMEYELHLRCYIQGLIWAGYPFARHTVGSCMAVRAATYARSGGMNTRKAGEDFYFMHKLLPVATFAYLDARVYPSCRASDRVPFGTGKAQMDYLMAGIASKTSYHPDCYGCLKAFFRQIPLLYEADPEEWNLPEPVREVLRTVGFTDRVLAIKKQSTSKASFLKKFWQWFDGFLVLKLTHYLRDRVYPNLPVAKAAEQLRERIQGKFGGARIVDLLFWYRERDGL